MTHIDAQLTAEPDAVGTARDLAKSGHTVDLNGIVAHATSENTIALTCLLACIATVAGIAWPIGSSIALAAVLVSTLTDADGGAGWVRNLIVKTVDHSVVVWPRQGHHDNPAQPTLLITAPLTRTVGPPTKAMQWFIAPMVGCIAGIGANAGSSIWGSTPSIGIAAMLLIAALGVIARRAWRTQTSQDNPARAVWEHELSRATDTARIRVVWCLVGGSEGHHDGLSTLLLNHSHRISKSQTRVLCLSPSTAPLSIMTQEGWIRPRRTDPWFHVAAKGLGLPVCQGTSSALTAIRLGWRAATLCIAPDQQHRAQLAVRRIIETAAASNRESAW